MRRDCFHNQYTTQQLLSILWDECEDRGIDAPDIALTARCSIARALEDMGVEFKDQ